MILQTLGVAMLCSSMVVPATNIEHKNAIYDDTNRSITLTTEELQYSFDLFNEYLNTLNTDTYYAFSGTTISYNGFTEGNFEEGYLEGGTRYRLEWYFYEESDEEYNGYVYHISFGFDSTYANKFSYSVGEMVEGDIDEFTTEPLVHDLTIIGIDIAYYGVIKAIIQSDIQNNQSSDEPSEDTPDSLYDLIYDYFEDTIFNSESLTEYSSEVLGQTITLQTWLCTTATIICLIVIFVFCLGFVVMLIKFTSNMMINLGR